MRWWNEGGEKRIRIKIREKADGQVGENSGKQESVCKDFL